MRIQIHIVHLMIFLRPRKSVAIINNKLDLYRLYHYLCLKYIQKTSQDQNPERFVNLFEIVRSENV